VTVVYLSAAPTNLAIAVRVGDVRTIILFYQTVALRA
jgi:hypothetical protein